MDLLSVLYTVVGCILSMLTIYYTYTKIVRHKKNDKNLEKEEILQEVKEHTATVKKELENEIEALEIKLNTLRESINKDMKHLKETYSTEIRNLGEKIEDLKNEVRNQHSQIVSLLSKMIDERG